MLGVMLEVGEGWRRRDCSGSFVDISGRVITIGPMTGVGARDQTGMLESSKGAEFWVGTPVKEFEVGNGGGARGVAGSVFRVGTPIGRETGVGVVESSIASLSCSSTAATFWGLLTTAACESVYNATVVSSLLLFTKTLLNLKSSEPETGRRQCSNNRPICSFFISEGSSI